MSLEQIDAGGISKALHKEFDDESPSIPVQEKKLPKPDGELNTERKLGDCYIFDYQKFENCKSSRFGSENDVERLKHDFTSLNFNVCSDNLNLSKEETLKVLKKAASKDHTESKYFVCCFLTHGQKGKLMMYDKPLKVDKILKQFSRSKCKTLSGKPKIFIFQACRGRCCEIGVPVESTDFGSVKKNPDFQDFLVVYSTYEGNVSFRTSNQFVKENNHGTFFIDEFCRTLEQFSGELGLLQILTIVNFRVAYLYESKTEEKKYTKKKQMPGFNSRLTTEVKFNKKIEMFRSPHTEYFDDRRRQTSFGLNSTSKPLEDKKIYNIQKFKRIKFLFLTNMKGDSETELNYCVSRLWSRVGYKGCDREEKKNWSGKELTNFLKEVASRKFPDTDGLICFIICKAEGDYLYDYNGNKFKMRGIVEQFTGEKCPSLVKKPKIFVFLLYSPPKKYWFSCLSPESTDSDNLIPVHADILETAYTIQNSEELDGVTQKFCDIFERKSSEDFLSQLTRMNAELAKDYGFFSAPKDNSATFSFYSTLTKTLILNNVKCENN